MSGRRFFLLFFLCAVVPFAAAKLSLSYGWFDSGATNKGQWLEQEIQLIPALASGDMHWTVAYVTGEQCEKNCLETIGLLQQLYTGLGRKQLGAQALFITTNASNPGIIPQHFSVINTVLLAHGNTDNNIPGKNTISAEQLRLLEHHFVIINQHGLVLLRYPLSAQAPAQVAADMRSDLLRLINYDRSRL